MTEKRFTSMYNEQCDMIQYVDTLKEEPNKWSICNVSGTLKKLNELAEKNKQLKKQLDETIDGLHKQITTSENAFEGLMKENKELRDACKNYDWYKLYTQLLNENKRLKKETQQVKNILKEYNDFVSFVDSAIAIGFIERIAWAVGMEL